MSSLWVGYRYIETTGSIRPSLVGDTHTHTVMAKAWIWRVVRRRSKFVKFILVTTCYTQAPNRTAAFETRAFFVALFVRQTLEPERDPQEGRQI